MASIAHIVAQLKGLSIHILDARTVHAACEAAQHRWRRRVLDPVLTVQLFVLQVLHGNVSCRAVRQLSGLRFSLTAYCNARMRLPVDVFARLAWALSSSACQTQRTLGRWCGHRVLLIDGSGLSMPDTPALQQHFGQPGRQKRGCGFPVMHVLWLFDAASGLIVDLLPNRWNRHDLADAHKLHPMLHDGDVLVGDRAFCSFAHLALLIDQRLHGVLRMHQRQLVDFRKGRKARQKLPKTRRAGRPTSTFVRKLGPHDQLVRWSKPKRRPQWMNQQDYDALPEDILVRELRYNTPTQCGFRTRQITLVTTLSDPRKYSRQDLAQLYQARWQIETNLRHLKQTMGMDVLRCKSVDGVLRELWVYVLVYNLVRLVMLQAAQHQRCPIDRISFIDGSVRQVAHF